MLNRIILFGAIALMLPSCLISKHSNLGFVKNRQIDKEAEVMAVSVNTVLARPILKKVLEEEKEDLDLMKLVKSVRGVKVLTIENQSDFTKINANVRRYLDRKKYEEWMTINTEDDFIVFNAKMKKDKIKRLFLTVTSQDGEGVFVRLKGKFSTDDILGTVNQMSLSDLRLKDHVQESDSADATVK